MILYNVASPLDSLPIWLHPASILYGPPGGVGSSHIRGQALGVNYGGRATQR